MLEYLRIRNFKGWRDTGAIRMAPITLFFGANSSGKSSIGQFLLMLKQTIESQDRKAVFYPGGKNSAVQLGSYREMVFGRDPDNKIAFEYRWSPSEPLKFADPLSGQVFSGDVIAFDAEVGLGEGQRRSLSLDRLKYELRKGEQTKLAIGMTRKPRARSKYEVKAETYVLTRKQGRAWPLGDPVRFYGFPDEVVAYYQNADFAQSLNLRHEQLFRSLSYLGPLRTRAERLYSWAGIEPESVGYAGENTVAAILAARGRSISTGYKHWSKPFQEVIARKLKQMGLIEEFRVRPISEQRQEYEVGVRTKGSHDWVDLPDVGFGISQVLPVLVQCFYARPGSIIFVEQPEIHLHPRAQSALADVMIEVINSRENGSDRKIQLIIETHSEHFLRRLQRRIAEEKVSQEIVSAYFANVSKVPPALEALELDEFGNILNWPEHFFGDEMGDIAGQAKAAIEKRKKKSLSSESMK
ncbi:MAG: DUF3696 domain-containing protein [Gammaproteobacteria bacterium]|nr:DUF3696 domain-containing protein [Gammaproteobacteria bacterium]